MNQLAPALARTRADALPSRLRRGHRKLSPADLTAEGRPAFALRDPAELGGASQTASPLILMRGQEVLSADDAGACRHSCKVGMLVAAGNRTEATCPRRRVSDRRSADLAERDRRRAVRVPMASRAEHLQVAPIEEKHSIASRERIPLVVNVQFPRAAALFAGRTLSANLPRSCGPSERVVPLRTQVVLLIKRSTSRLSRAGARAVFPVPDRFCTRDGSEGRTAEETRTGRRALAISPRPKAGKRAETGALMLSTGLERSAAGLAFSGSHETCIVHLRGGVK
jgi:hypothetical protein